MPSAVFTDSRFRLDYSVTQQSQDVANNRSLVRRVLVIVKTGSSYANSANTSTWSVNDREGASIVRSRSGTFTYNFGNYSSLTLMDETVWVVHNDDGSKAYESTADVRADTPVGNASLPWGGVTLTKIPRATTPQISGGGFTTGLTSTINLPRAVSDYVHDVSWSLGAKSGTIATGAGVSTTWAPAHSLMTELPNAASGQVTLTVVTKHGATGAIIGTTNTPFTLIAAASVVPTVTGVAWDDTNPTVKANIGAFVQGLSLIKGNVVAAGTFGSVIAAKRLVVAGNVLPEDQIFQITSPGTVTASGEATDSRGRTGAAAADFTVLAYEPPKLGVNGWQVRRANASNVADDNGQYLRLELHVIAKSLIVGAEKNALTISVRTRPTNGAWTNRNTLNPGLIQNGAVQVSGGAAFLVSQSYEVEISISDKTGVSPLLLRTIVGTTVVAIDIRDNRVGIGKMHEYGTLDVAGDIYSNGVRVPRLDELPGAASEVIAGIVARASQAQVNAGTDTTRYVSPATLTGWTAGHVAGIPAIPASVEVTAGTATVREDGLIVFTGAPMIHLNGIFLPDSDSAYQMVARVVSATAQPVWMRGRSNGSTKTTVYNRLANSIQYAAGPGRHAEFGSSAAGYIKPAAGAAQDVASAKATFVKSAASSATQLLLSSWSSESSDRRLWEEYSDFSGNHDGLTIAGGSGGALTGWARFWKVA